MLLRIPIRRSLAQLCSYAAIKFYHLYFRGTYTYRSRQSLYIIQKFDNSFLLATVCRKSVASVESVLQFLSNNIQEQKNILYYFFAGCRGTSIQNGEVRQTIKCFTCPYKNIVISSANYQEYLIITIKIASIAWLVRCQAL